MERHAVHGHTQVQARGAGHVVQELRGRVTPVPVVWPPESGQLFRDAERQGHRNRSFGPIVDVGRRHRVRSGIGKQP